MSQVDQLRCSSSPYPLGMEMGIKMKMEIGMEIGMEMEGIVVQWLEHRPVTAEVAGSNPVNLVAFPYFP
jgi:hypothetical protein